MSPTPSNNSGVRLAELMASLSIATDLGLGQPMEHALSSCIVAVRLAGKCGYSEDHCPGRPWSRCKPCIGHEQSGSVQTSPGVFVGTDQWTVIGGTGRFGGATGSGTGVTHIDLNNGNISLSN